MPFPEPLTVTIYSLLVLGAGWVGRAAKSDDSIRAEIRKDYAERDAKREERITKAESAVADLRKEKDTAVVEKYAAERLVAVLQEQIATKDRHIGYLTQEKRELEARLAEHEKE